MWKTVRPEGNNNTNATTTTTTDQQQQKIENETIKLMTTRAIIWHTGDIGFINEVEHVKVYQKIHTAIHASLPHFFLFFYLILNCYINAFCSERF